MKLYKVIQRNSLFQHNILTIKILKFTIISVILSFMFIEIVPAKTYSSYTYGSGVNPCTTWKKWRKTEYGWYQDSEWVKGYISSYSSYGKRPLRQTNSDDIIAFMDGYCQKYPLNIIRDAAQAIIKELIIK